MSTNYFPTFRRLMRAIPLSLLRLAPSFESHGLLRMLALAVEQNLELPPLLRALARDSAGRRRASLNRLAALLSEGRSLPNALEQVPRLLPVEDILAIRCGAQSGTLAPTLRDLVEARATGEMEVRTQIRQTMGYAATVLIVGLLIFSFVIVKIMPTVEAMFDDFAVELPAPTQLVIACAEGFAQYWPLLLLVALALGWALWSNWPGRSLRGGVLGRLLQPWLQVRSADLLQNLSIAASAGRPMPGVLSTLAKYHHDASLRRKLLFVRNEVEQGVAPWSAMREARLLTPAEVRAMESSATVGNQVWTMQQLAERRRRSLHRRLKSLAEFISPAAIVVLGLLVGLFCLAVFSPLTHLIQSLS